MKNKYILFFCWVVFSLIGSGCKKVVDVDVPINRMTRQTLFSNDVTAIAVMNGIYASLANASNSVGGFLGHSFWLGLAADELRILPGQTNTTLMAYYQNNLNTDPIISTGADFWPTCYIHIYKFNDVIGGSEESSGLTPLVRQRLIGEAKFMRSYLFYYLVNLYGDVPLPLSTNYELNAVLPRTAKEQVYAQVINDLKEAIQLLPESFQDATLLRPSSDRIRPTKWAAHALLARVYLYTGKNVEAELEATSVLNNSSLFSLQNLDNAFLRGSAEVIFQFQPTGSANFNTPEGYVFNLPATGPTTTTNVNNPFFLTSSLLNAFESGDLRRTKWINEVTPSSTTYFYPYKYKLGGATSPGTEFSTLLRVGEQYLIRAEARILQGGAKVAEGIADLNMLRSRSRGEVTSVVPDPLPALSLAMVQDSALQAVVRERRVELFAEQGHRWLDLKRWGKIDEVMSQESVDKGVVWNSFQQLFPIPQFDILRNPTLFGRQNPGYN